MKKLLFLIITVSLVLAMTACGEKETKEKTPEKDKVVKTERSIDAIGTALELKAGEETLFTMLNAKAGKEFNDGAVEIYEFDKASEEYKGIEADGKVLDLAVAAHNDGFALMFPEGQAEDADLIKKFEELKFK